MKKFKVLLVIVLLLNALYSAYMYEYYAYNSKTSSFAVTYFNKDLSNPKLNHEETMVLIEHWKCVNIECDKSKKEWLNIMLFNVVILFLVVVVPRANKKSSKFELME
ncbi:hypothetical protein CJD36_006225 [Flavipsychrobacter stenotrophus]|uniref:Uncharacterized protein n=1 Tax=Flavipsychrobacter stenotrophus TaxID=2077091 RepID=A0A2S7SXU0_9BACT|nr:hypothetical protein [Flavipsychrobacter stenotrophus]PQJ11395.1 hypothetical protein CJD36_006225 [Flavipsychrobacter stenotrophus]